MKANIDDNDWSIAGKHEVNADVHVIGRVDIEGINCAMFLGACERMMETVRSFLASIGVPPARCELELNIYTHMHKTSDKQRHTRMQPTNKDACE